ncbi:MAG: prepilin-type N-terminal cleavage/methylation domain-containing protein [Epulopiscium sp.]|nr:prepilin-type N-terminal cleavage/methylation domain-containing protein [Candidatus Epulonipiscium sp.]
MLRKLSKEEKGFTMIELIIVIAIIAIIGAIIAPNFGKTTAKARLNADVNSVKTLQKLAEMYLAEHEPTAFDSLGAQEVIEKLIESGSLKETDLKKDDDDKYIPQSEKCKWQWESRTFKLDASEAEDSLKELVEALPPDQQSLVKLSK